MLVRLTMVCSGATAATRRALFPLDEPLERRALALGAALATRLRRADRILTSPALRAAQTAAALSPPAAVTPALRDCDHGRWAGKSLAEVEKDEPKAIAAWLSDVGAAPHGGESLADLQRRVSAWMDAALAARGHTVAVTHAAVIRAAIVHVLDAPLEALRRIDVEPLSIVEFRGDGRRWMLRAGGVVAAKAGTPS